MVTFTPLPTSFGSFTPATDANDSTYGDLGGSYGVTSYTYGGLLIAYSPLVSYVGSFTPSGT